MNCPQCGAENPRNKKYCIACGEIIKPGFFSRRTNGELVRQFRKSEPGKAHIHHNFDQMSSTSRKRLFIAALVIFLMISVGAMFFIVKTVQENARSEAFNNDLHARLTADYSEENKDDISVSGFYGTRIVINSDMDFTDFLDSAESESDVSLYTSLVHPLFRLIGLQANIDRSELIFIYSSKESYKNDKKYQRFSRMSPVIQINSATDSYKLYEDSSGENVFLVDGVVYEEPDFDQVYSYGNPTPALRELMEKEGTTLNAIEVQYDMRNNVDKKFGLEGTAELCDYYNWGYDDDIEPSYFCMEVTPNGGSYSDRWYIYSSRNSFSELYGDLLDGNVDIKLIAEIDSYRFEKNQQNQATLVRASWHGD